MADAVTAKVLGLKELGAAMEALGEEVAQKIARSMTNAGAQLVKKAAISNAPESVAPHFLEGITVEPGNLKKNIIVRRIPNNRTHLTSEHIVTVRGKKRDGYAARYGRLVEHGTVKMPPKSYLRPALDQNVSAATAAMQKKGERMVEAAVKKANRSKVK